MNKVKQIVDWVTRVEAVKHQAPGNLVASDLQFEEVPIKDLQEYAKRNPNAKLWEANEDFPWVCLELNIGVIRVKVLSGRSRVLNKEKAAVGATA